MYTIKDLAEGRVAVINDGDLKDLEKVLRKAFPNDKGGVGGSCKYYFAVGEEWDFNNKVSMSIQSVKDFLKQIEEELWTPKRGDKVLVSFTGEEGYYLERIFVAEIKNALHPYIIVNENFKEKFIKGEPFDTFNTSHIKPIPTPQPQTEVTMDEIAEKFNIKVENLKIVK